MVAVALAMATATEMSTSFYASDSSLSRKKNCVCACGCPLAVTAVLAESSVVALTAAPLTAWPAKRFAALIAGDVEARACGGPAAAALASEMSAFAVVELAMVASVVALVALVSGFWSLSRRRRAALPFPLWEELPLEEAASDGQCAFSSSQGSGLCAERAAVWVSAALLASAAIWVLAAELAAALQSVVGVSAPRCCNEGGRQVAEEASASLLLAFFGLALLGLAASVLAQLWVCAEFATSCWSFAELSRAALVVAPRLASGLGV